MNILVSSDLLVDGGEVIDRQTLISMTVANHHNGTALAHLIAFLDVFNEHELDAFDYKIEYIKNMLTEYKNGLGNSFENLVKPMRFVELKDEDAAALVAMKNIVTSIRQIDANDVLGQFFLNVGKMLESNNGERIDLGSSVKSENFVFDMGFNAMQHVILDAGHREWSAEAYIEFENQYF